MQDTCIKKPRGRLAKQDASGRGWKWLRCRLALPLLLAAALVLAGQTVASAQIVTFDVPNSDGTFPLKVNLGGSVAGEYLTYTSRLQCFLRTPDGTITAFDPPGDASGATLGGLNDAGEVVGYYYGYYGNSNLTEVGFLRDASGNFTNIVPSGSTYTTADGINNNGEIAGTWVDSSDGVHGFVYQAGTYTSFNVPGATSIYGVLINNNGEVAGYYYDSNNYSHGFVRDPSGTVTTIDAPAGYTDLLIFGLNDNGQVTGWYGVGSGSSFVNYGFIWQAGSFTTFDGSPTLALTFPQSINLAGTVVGYSCNNGICDGFVRNPLGAISSLSVSGAYSTEPSEVNAGGTIAGIWVDSPSAYYLRHGFIEVSALGQAAANLIIELSDPTLALTQGEINSLTDKLNNVMASIQAGLNKQAINQLDAFINSVDTSVKTGKMSSQAGTTLTSAANAIIAKLQ